MRRSLEPGLTYLPHLTPRRLGSRKDRMRSSILLASLLVLSVGTCLAEDLTLPSNTIMRADRSLVSLKAGTVVEVLDRNDKTISVRYKGQTGSIPTSSLTAKPQAPVASAPASVVVDHPQSVYGNLVKKAENNIAKHDENLVKPTDETTK